MVPFHAVVCDAKGVPESGVTVSVKLSGTQTLAALFSDNGSTAKVNAFQNAANGGYNFFAANGRYRVDFTKTGHPSIPSLEIRLYDPADAPKFSVHRNGANQVGIVTGVFTKVLWTTEIYDVGAAFDPSANSRWTPGRIGKARLSAAVLWDTISDLAAMAIVVQKNGAPHKSVTAAAGGTGNQGLMIACDVAVDAITDFFEVYVLQTSGVNRDIRGAASESWFMGHLFDEP